MYKTVLGAISGASIMAMSAGAQDALVTEQGMNDLRADWVVGANVSSHEGQNIGSIEDLILDPSDGSVVAAVVSVGGFLGFGSKSIAIEWTELEMNWDANEVLVSLSREEADDAPEFIFRAREYEPAPDPAPGGGGMPAGGAPAPAPAPN